ncbi:VWA domain-containing protein [Halorubrum sp. Ib24]|uniref:VWA domain-containing protein n=1 Tax=Halorubrum sp. Ib24 TaxID=1383850 RepID=UPI0018E97D57|nr:VWA domain-containing protein [Halorubrum sp. Ib24]
MARSDGTATETPDFPAAREHLLTELIRFVAVLRRDGVAVPASGALDAARAIAAVGLTDERRVEDGAASEPCSPRPARRRRPLRRGVPDVLAPPPERPRPDRHRPRRPVAGVRGGGRRRGPNGGRGGADHRLRRRRRGGARPARRRGAAGDGRRRRRRPHRPDPDRPPPRRRRSADRGAARGDGRAPVQRGRRERARRGGRAGAVERGPRGRGAVRRRALVAARAARRRSPDGPNVDARGALRASLQTGGAPIDLPRDAPTPSELRCCLLVDVSGSVLDTIDRSALLGLGERVAASARDARVFLFDTDLAEATAAFADPGGEPAEALRAAQIEWGGGTKIGGAFDALRRTAPHAVDRRTVVVVVSDGLDVGDPDLLTDGITWLADRADGVVWLNPLAVSPSFEPASRGMSDAAPYVDGLFGFAEGADLAEAARQIERRGLGGPVGYEHDPRRTGGAPGGGRGRTDDEARTGDAGEEGVV